MPLASLVPAIQAADESGLGRKLPVHLHHGARELDVEPVGLGAELDDEVGPDAEGDGAIALGRGLPDLGRGVEPSDRRPAPAQRAGRQTAPREEAADGRREARIVRGGHFLYTSWRTTNLTTRMQACQSRRRGGVGLARARARAIAKRTKSQEGGVLGPNPDGASHGEESCLSLAYTLTLSHTLCLSLRSPRASDCPLCARVRRRWKVECRHVLR